MPTTAVWPSIFRRRSSASAGIAAAARSVDPSDTPVVIILSLLDRDAAVLEQASPLSVYTRRKKISSIGTRRRRPADPVRRRRFERCARPEPGRDGVTTPLSNSTTTALRNMEIDTTRRGRRRPEARSPNNPGRVHPRSGPGRPPRTTGHGTREAPDSCRRRSWPSSSSRSAWLGRRGF